MKPRYIYFLLTGSLILYSSEAYLALASKVTDKVFTQQGKAANELATALEISSSEVSRIQLELPKAMEHTAHISSPGKYPEPKRNAQGLLDLVDEPSEALKNFIHWDPKRHEMQVGDLWVDHATGLPQRSGLRYSFSSPNLGPKKNRTPGWAKFEKFMMKRPAEPGPQGYSTRIYRLGTTTQILISLVESTDSAHRRLTIETGEALHGSPASDDRQ